MAYTIKPNLYGGLIASTMKIPFIANITGLGRAVQNEGILQSAVKKMYSLCLRKATCVFAQNQDIKAFLLERKLNGRIIVVPGSGVNLEQHCFEEYPTDDGSITFVTIGRLMRDKGTDEILTAARRIKDQHPHTRFQFIGFDDGNYQDKVEEAVKEGIVEYPGFQDDVHSWIADSHAIIHASYHEGMANVLLECASTGRPILATDIPGCRETFDEGVSGFGFEPQDIESLVEAIERFIALPYADKKAMGIAGRRKMEMEFDRRIVVDTYIKEIETIIG
jgi:galacturonosyltransferase